MPPRLHASMPLRLHAEGEFRHKQKEGLLAGQARVKQVAQAG